MPLCRPCLLRFHLLTFERSVHFFLGLASRFGRLSSAWDSFKVKVDDDYQITNLFDALCYSFCLQESVKGQNDTYAYHSYITFMAVSLCIFDFFLSFSIWYLPLLVIRFRFAECFLFSFMRIPIFRSCKQPRVCLWCGKTERKKKHF